MRNTVLCLVALAGCASSNPTVSRDDAKQLNKDQRYAHSSNGDIINGPSDINERVVGQRDLAGNVHVTTDHYFLQRADQLSCAQISLGQLAMQRGAGTLQVADRIVGEQQRLDDSIRAEARRRGFYLPRQSCYTENYQQLSALQGPEFDRNYIAVQRSLAAEQIALWDDVLQSTSDRRLAQFAFDTRPQLQSNYAEIDRYRF
jgi:predicted outer membrane protein